MIAYLELAAIIFGSSLIPIFGPPSWAFAVFFYHRYHLNFLLTVFLAAASTALGRVLLAWLTGRLRHVLPQKFVSNLEAARTEIQKRRGRAWLFVTLFVLSPLPSAQLFEAAGLMEVRLMPLGLAFFAGRLVSNTFYLSVTKAAGSVGSIWKVDFDSWPAILAEIGLALSLVALGNYRWIVRRMRASSK